MSISINKKIRSKIVNKLRLSELATQLYHLQQHQKFKLSNKALSKDKAYLQYYLVKHYHVIEKGLALSDPRLGFGQPKILDLLDKARMYEDKFGSDSILSAIRETLTEYIRLHDRNNFSLPEKLNHEIKTFINKTTSKENGGLKYINKSSASNLNIDAFREFAQSRVSVRNFSEEPVLEKTIYNAVDAAKHAPSVCNRQGWKVHYYSEKTKIIQLLALQNGNKGFTENIDKLLIVTSDDRAFVRYESNQPFIDGGLFSMNLLLALHASGLGACCLNTCMSYRAERKVKSLGGIPDHERLIMMIAVGNLKPEYSVAYSNRKETNSILVSH